MCFEECFFKRNMFFREEYILKRNEHLDTDVVCHVVGAVRVVPEVVAVLKDRKNVKLGSLLKANSNMYQNVHFSRL